MTPFPFFHHLPDTTVLAIAENSTPINSEGDTTSVILGIKWRRILSAIWRAHRMGGDQLKMKNLASSHQSRATTDGVTWRCDRGEHRQGRPLLSTSSKSGCGHRLIPRDGAYWVYEVLSSQRTCPARVAQVGGTIPRSRLAVHCSPLLFQVLARSVCPGLPFSFRRPRSKSLKKYLCSAKITARCSRNSLDTPRQGLRL